MKNVFKDLTFITIFAILLHFCTTVFVLKGSGYGSDVTSFYNLDRNSLDIIFFGSSHSYATFSPQVIEQETGLKSYNFATQQQPIYITYHYMIEALKTQKPKYFVLEAWMLPMEMDYAKEGVTRDAIDKMKPSVNKFNAINVSVENYEDRFSYYFNIIKYHSRFADLTFDDIMDRLNHKAINNLGYTALPENKEIVIDNKEILKISDQKQIPEKNLKYLNKIINLANDNNIELIVVLAPCKLSENKQMMLNWLKEYLSDLNIKYVDYSDYKKIDFEAGDFYDEGHLSKNGAYKVSLDFSQIFK